MCKTRRAWWLILVVLAAGCNHQDTEALVRIGKKVQMRTQAVTGDVKSSAANSWHAMGEFGAEVRVAARLRWDKELEDVSIEVLPSGTGVELRGKVYNLDQHRRAVMLAESTTGVDGVKDSLVESER